MFQNKYRMLFVAFKVLNYVIMLFNFFFFIYDIDLKANNVWTLSALDMKDEEVASCILAN